MHFNYQSSYNCEVDRPWPQHLIALNLNRHGLENKDPKPRTNITVRE